MNMSSMATKSGPLWRSMRTGCSASCAQAADGKPQQGISFLLIDMNTPGIEVKPIITIDGGHEVNEVFLTDVRVPAKNLVGEQG